MQNMSYTYDNAGNVTTISDALAGPQAQEFSYNDADMVIQASAAGGTYGLYSESYSYSSGNLYNKGGVTNTYGDPAHPHAVTERSNGNTYVYDDNGNQTRREISNDTYDLKYDAENRLVEVKKNSTVIATFVYDGGGKQVKSTINGVTTYYVGQHYKKEGTVVTKYYYAGAERIAMRQGGVLYYIFGDHLGSTAVVKNTQGGKTELRYTAWGTTRYEYGSTPTDRRYTGQREVDDVGLYFYNARWYDPALGRFIQADTIVPEAGNPQAWDRYAYANNNPTNSTDPTGHRACADVDSYGNCITEPIEKKDPEPHQPVSLIGGNPPYRLTFTPTTNPTLSAWLTATPTGTLPTPITYIRAGYTSTPTPSPTQTPTPAATPDLEEAFDFFFEPNLSGAPHFSDVLPPPYNTEIKFWGTFIWTFKEILKYSLSVSERSTQSYIYSPTPSVTSTSMPILTPLPSYTPTIFFFTPTLTPTIPTITPQWTNAYP